MMGNKPEYPNAQKYPTQAAKAQREQAAGQAKIRDMARQPMRKGKLTRGKGRRG